jgi:hypothetical protein
MALVAITLVGRRAEAGDRELEVLFVNMTPDAQSSPASKGCVADLRGKVKAGYTHVASLGETAARKAAGQAGDSSFLEWPASAVNAIGAHQASGLDALILVDCRPEARRLDVLVAPASGAIVRLQLRRVAIDRRAIDWLAVEVMVHAWAGFSP